MQIFVVLEETPGLADGDDPSVSVLAVCRHEARANKRAAEPGNFFCWVSPMELDEAPE